MAKRGTPEATDLLRNQIQMTLERAVKHDDPRVAIRQRLAILRQQKIEVLKRDFIRRRFTPTEKQKELMRLGADFKRRSIFAGNRVGKTVAGCAELTYHLTGEYPDWWVGHRFERPIKAWCASVTKEMTITGLQEMLMGPMHAVGTGFIPWARIASWDKMQNVPGGIARVRVRWGDPEDNRESALIFKSYEQGRKSFQTERVDFIGLDEEPPYEIFRECQMRLIGSDSDPGGHMLLTFTPLSGMTQVCLAFLEPEEFMNDDIPDYAEDVASLTTYVTASWQDNPHLSKAEIAELIKTTPKHELEARQFGRPSLGAGKIYKIPESRILVEPFPIPDHWPQGIGLDHGWTHPTAITHWARNPQTGVCYLVSTWKESEMEIPEVASVLRQMSGLTIPIFADPAGKAERQEAGGRSTFDQYWDEGLLLIEADNQVNAGLEEFRQGLSSGMIKVMGYEGGTGPNEAWFVEYRLYRRNDKSKVVKERDDAMDSGRYAFRHRDEWAPKVKPQSERRSRRTQAGRSMRTL